MQTRTLGRTGIQAGVIGLVTKHLPADHQNMDAVLDLAVAGGVNYIDLFSDPTFATFTDYLEAIEPAVHRRRERLVLCLHWGFVYQEPIDQCQLAFDQALECLAKNYAEIAMISMVDAESMWKGWARPAIERIQHYQRDGRVGFIGMSSHNVDIARKAVESGLIDVLMFPVNIYQHQGDPAGSTSPLCSCDLSVFPLFNILQCFGMSYPVDG